MKDSGVPWVGIVPREWSIKPIRSDFEEVTEKNNHGLVQNALKFTYGSIVPKENFDADSDDYVASTIRSYTVVTPGTIMLNGLNLNFDFVSQRIGLVKETGVITSAYIAFRTVDSNNISPEFVAYLLKSYDACKAFHNMGGGVRKILNFSELKKQYGIPTRLLDVTESALVALYFACCDKLDKDGEVFVFVRENNGVGYSKKSSLHSSAFYY